MNDSINCKDVCYAIKINKLISEIIESYGNDFMKKINNQLLIDYHRIDICINNIRYNNPYTFLFMIKKLKNIKHHILPTLYNVILILSSQAPFFYHYEFLRKYIIKDLDIVQDKSRAKINIEINDNKIILHLRKSFCHIDIKTETIINKYNVIMSMDITDMDAYSYLTCE